MKTLKCKPTCRPEEGIHDLGDAFVYEDTQCLLCGTKPVPHEGYSFPCRCSATGSHVPKLTKPNF